MTRPKKLYIRKMEQETQNRPQSTRGEKITPTFILSLVSFLYFIAIMAITQFYNLRTEVTKLQMDNMWMREQTKENKEQFKQINNELQEIKKLINERPEK